MLTERQRAVLFFICRYIKETGESPTIATVNKGASVTYAQDCIAALIRRGYMRRKSPKPNVAANFELTKAGEEVCAGMLVIPPIPSMPSSSWNPAEKPSPLTKTDTIPDPHVFLRDEMTDGYMVRPGRKTPPADTPKPTEGIVQPRTAFEPAASEPTAEQPPPVPEPAPKKRKPDLAIKAEFRPFAGGGSWRAVAGEGAGISQVDDASSTRTTLARLVEAEKLVDIIGWDLARSLAERLRLARSSAPLAIGEQ